MDSNARPSVSELRRLQRQRKISRRQFIRLTGMLGLTAGGATVLAACSTPAPAPAAPTAAPAAGAAASPTEAPLVATPVPATAVPATAAPAAAATSSKVLKIRLVTDITQVDPAFNPAGADTMICNAVGQGLVSYKPGTWDIVNVLADSIKTSEDGLRIDFELKEGVQFHHGYGELTADDVKFSFERFIDPEVAASYKDDWGTLDHVEVTGKYAGTIILKEPFAPLWVSTLPATSGLILSRKAVSEKGKDYATSPVGSGPYEFSEWVPKQHVILKRFKDYAGPQPEWDEIQAILIPEDSQAEIALETGELDFGQIATDAVQRFQDNKKFKVAQVTTFDYNGLLMNVQHPKLKDINVRQAIRYAIDVPAIVQGAYDGKAARACAALAPGQLGFWKDAPCYDRDLAKAKDYFAKAGLQTLDLTLSVYNSERERAVAEIVQANLAEIGIKVDIVAQDDATYWDASMGDKGLNELQLSYIEWTTTNPDPAWTTMWFTCEQVKQYNWMEWCDTQYDTLHNAAKKEMDAAKRQDLYVQLQKVWDENANAVWTVHPMLYFAGTANLVPALYPTGLPIPQAFKSA